MKKRIFFITSGVCLVVMMFVAGFMWLLSAQRDKEEKYLKTRQGFYYLVKIAETAGLPRGGQIEDIYFTNKEPEWDNSQTVITLRDYFHPEPYLSSAEGIHNEKIQIRPGGATIKIQKNPLFKEEELSVPLKEVE